MACLTSDELFDFGAESEHDQDPKLSDGILPLREQKEQYAQLASITNDSIGVLKLSQNARRNKLPLLFRLDALAKALSVIAIYGNVAGWLGGWVSVTLRYCIKTAKAIGKLFRPSESPIILVF